MIGWVFLAGVATAAVEVVVFVLVGQWIGWGWTVLLVLAASLAGVVLLQRESIEAWRKLGVVLQAGRPPGAQVIDGLVGLVGALLLAAPGLLTGLVGALLLVPPLRRLAGWQAERRAERQLSSAAAGDLFGPRRVRVWRGQPHQDGPAEAAGPTIEGEIVGRAAGEPDSAGRPDDGR